LPSKGGDGFLRCGLLLFGAIALAFTDFHRRSSGPEIRTGVAWQLISRRHLIGLDLLLCHPEPAEGWATAKHSSRLETTIYSPIMPKVKNKK